LPSNKLKLKWRCNFLLSSALDKFETKAESKRKSQRLLIFNFDNIQEPAPEVIVQVFEETKRQGVLIGKGGLYGNVIRTGMMLNSTRDNVDELIAALDKGFAL